MRLFNPETPFLRSIELAIRSTGGQHQPATRTGGRELLSVAWFPSLPNGVLSYDDDTNQWEQGGEEAEDENLMLHIADDGLTQIGPGDDNMTWLETSLKAGDELMELMEFYESTNANKIGSSSISAKPLSDLIDEVYLLVSQKEGHQRLFPLRGQQFAKEHPQIAPMVDAWLTNDWDAIMAQGGYGDLGSWLEEKGFAESLGTTETICLGDLILTGDGGVYFAGMLVAGAESDLGFAPALVLRPNPQTSLMWLSDYFLHAAEADGLVERLCKGWKYLPKGLNNIKITCPSAKRDQVAESIMRRTAREAYMGYLKSAMRMREPFDQITAIYKKRARAAQGLHTELLDDLEAMQHPLPFFLEYPYRVYRREGDHVCKIRAAQRLLGVLCKAPLYLVVEELLSIGHPLGSEIMDKLKAQPPSDGMLASLQKEVADILGSDEEQILSVFQELLPVLVSNGPLLNVVTARNRMHHEPYDEGGFLKAVAEQAPRIMDTLRNALREVRFLVSTHVKNIEGETILTADDACSSEAHFRSIDVKVSLPLHEFPTGQLIAWRATPERSLRLSHLVTSTMITQQSRDFGLFDRMESNEPHFTFLRSE